VCGEARQVAWVGACPARFARACGVRAARGARLNSWPPYAYSRPYTSTPLWNTPMPTHAVCCTQKAHNSSV
jgi:hypothetical protein